MRGFLSIDIDVSDLQVNQCNAPAAFEYQRIRSSKVLNHEDVFSQIEAFHNSNKCHMDSMQVCVKFFKNQRWSFWKFIPTLY